MKKEKPTILTKETILKAVEILRAHNRVYKPGRVIRSMDSLAKWLDAGNYVFFRGKSYHPGWVRGFQLGYVMWNLKAGQVRKAVRIEK